MFTYYVGSDLCPNREKNYETWNNTKYREVLYYI